MTPSALFFFFKEILVIVYTFHLNKAARVIFYRDYINLLINEGEITAFPLKRITQNLRPKKTA